MSKDILRKFYVFGDDAKEMDLLVLKFGGASVASASFFASIAELIIERAKNFKKIVVVVSAMGNTTDQLFSLAKEVNPSPPQRECDMLLTVGERISIALLAMALSRRFVDAVSFTGSQSGIVTSCQHSSAKILDVRPSRILKALQENKIPIVAGFQGVSKDEGEITTLGRGGSDTTAVALGAALRADRVEFFKDVPGIFTSDPKIDFNAAHCPRLTYQEALGIVNQGAKVLNPRSIELAQKNALPLFVTSFKKDQTYEGTWITEKRERPSSPLYED